MNYYSLPRSHVYTSFCSAIFSLIGSLHFVGQVLDAAGGTCQSWYGCKMFSRIVWHPAWSCQRIARWCAEFHGERSPRWLLVFVFHCNISYLYIDILYIHSFSFIPSYDIVGRPTFESLLRMLSTFVQPWDVESGDDREVLMEVLKIDGQLLQHMSETWLIHSYDALLGTNMDKWWLNGWLNWW